MAEFLHFFKGKLTNCSLTFIALFFLGFVSAQTVSTVSETVERDCNGNTAQLADWLASHGGASAPDACGNVTWSYVKNVCGNDYVDRLLTNEADFSGNETLINFDDRTPGTFNGDEYSEKGIVFSTTGEGMSIAEPNVGPCTYPTSYSGLNHFGNFPTDCSKPNGSLTLNFTNGINRVGFRAASNFSDDFTIEVSCLSKGYVVGVESYTATGPYSYQFIGIESSIEFDQLVITVVNVVNGSIALDDLRFEACDSTESDEQSCSISTQYFFIAKDDCGDAFITKATFTIVDTTGPTIDTAATDSTVESDGGGNTAELNAWLASNGGTGAASDVCGGVSWSNNFNTLRDLCGATGSATVKFTATDDCGNFSDTTAEFTIVDTTAPDNISISAPLGPVEIGADVPLTATYTDVSPGSAIWYFSSNGITYEYSKAGDVVGETIKFNNTEPKIPTGVYTIKLVVTDACDNSSETIHTVSETIQTQYLVVYDASGGFVTGGGWIYSPNGALVGTAKTGKANFGFVAKYKTGKNNINEVDGNTNFQFKEGDFHFKSSSHKEMSLVISGERKATYKGSGTVNGSGSYDFMVTVIDGEAPGAGQGDVDTFRIKVWTSGSPSDVVYDNELGNAENADATTDLGGGSIVIHKPKGNEKEQEGTLVKTTPIIMQEMDPEILESLAASPNPVVSSSTVRFSLKEDANVVLQVYDYSGRMIETLYNGQVKAYQNYDVDFQRKNLMSGIYIVKLTTDKGQSYDKRIIVE